MTLPIEVDKEDLMILLNNYEQRFKSKLTDVESIRSSLASAEKELQVLQEKVQKLRKQIDPNPGEARESFPINGTWHDRIRFVLGLFNRPMTTSEIVTVLEEYMKDWDRKKLMTSVSATISAAIGNIYNREKERVWIK